MKFLFISGFIFIAQTSFAYIPPGNFIIQSWGKKHPNLKSLRIESTVSLSGVQFKEITVYDLHAHALRSVVRDDAGHDLYRAEKSDSDVALPTRLLLDSNASAITALLKSQGVANETVTLKRWKGSIAWVLGMPDAPELWIEKDTFLPLRLLLNSVSYDFSNYKFQHGMDYPKVIEVTKNNTLVLHDELGEIQINTGSDLKPQAATGYTEYGTGISQSMRDLIQQYYELIR